MNGNDEPLARLLARLADATPDSARAARVQGRCRKVLARRTARTARHPIRRVESVCVVGLCLAYLMSVILQALH